jgi:D-alanine-D-alanine ligase
MHIGLTYDLRSEYLAQGYGEEVTAEFDRDETIHALAGTLESLGHRVDRVGNIFNLTKRLAVGAKWDLVFNVAEGLYGLARESAIPGLLEAHRIPCTFSDSLTLAVCLHKTTTKRIVRDLGISTPDFAEVRSISDVDRIILDFPLFVKPVAEGTSKGISANSKISNKATLRNTCIELLEKYRQPVLVETFLPGREFTVSIIGTGEKAWVAGVMEVLPKNSAQANAYSYINKEQSEQLMDYRLVTDQQGKTAASLALAVWRGLDCRDSGRMDFRCDAAGNPQFMEVNPLAGLHPTHSDLPITWNLLGRDFPELIKAIVDSAAERVIANKKGIGA